MRCDELDVVSTQIPTLEGVLEARVIYDPAHEGPGGALLCPPHPLLAGNLDNNVALAVARCVAGAGLPVVAFNYRGVGGSFQPDPSLPLFESWSRLDAEGTYDGVVRDVEAAFGWAESMLGPLHVVAYSFGAFVAARSPRLRAAARSWSLIAPPWGAHDFSGLADLAAPCLLVSAEDDGLAVTGKAPTPVGTRRVVVPSSDHFFRGHEEEVGGAVAEFLSGRPTAAGRALPRTGGR